MIWRKTKEPRAFGGSGVASDPRRGCCAVGRERRVEPRHVENRLRVLALSDRHVHGSGTFGPAARAVLLVEVIGDAIRERRSLLFGKVNSGFGEEAQLDPSGNEAAQP